MTGDEAAVLVPQQVFAWALRTFAGAPGFGFVGASTPVVRGSLPPPLPEFVPDTRAAAAADLGEPLTAVEFDASGPDGPVLTVKRDLGLDSSGRRGRHVVQILTDPEHRLDARSAAAAAPDLLSALTWALDAPPCDDLPLVRLPLLDRDDVGVDDPEVASSVRLVTAAAVMGWEQRRRVVVQGVPERFALPAVRGALDLLPAHVARALSFSTYRGHVERSPFDVTIASAASVVPRTPSARGPLYVSGAGVDARTAALVEALAAMTVAERDRVRAVDDVERLSRLRSAVLGLGHGGPDDDTLRLLLDSWPDLAAADRAATVEAVARRAADLDRDPVPHRALAVLDGASLDRIRETVVAAATCTAIDAPTRFPAALARAAQWGVHGAVLVEPVVGAIGGRLRSGPLLEGHRSAVGWVRSHTADHGPVTPGVLLDWLDDPVAADELLREWNVVAAQVALSPWLRPEWARLHPGAVARVAARFAGPSAAALDAQVSVGTLSARDVAVGLAGAGADGVLPLAGVVALMRDREVACQVHGRMVAPPSLQAGWVPAARGDSADSPPEGAGDDGGDRAPRASTAVAVATGLLCVVLVVLSVAGGSTQWLLLLPAALCGAVTVVALSRTRRRPR